MVRRAVDSNWSDVFHSHRHYRRLFYFYLSETQDNYFCLASMISYLISHFFHLLFAKVYLVVYQNRWRIKASFTLRESDECATLMIYLKSKFYLRVHSVWRTLQCGKLWRIKTIIFQKVFWPHSYNFQSSYVATVFNKRCYNHVHTKEGLIVITARSLTVRFVLTHHSRVP